MFLYSKVFSKAFVEYSIFCLTLLCCNRTIPFRWKISNYCKYAAVYEKLFHERFAAYRIEPTVWNDDIPDSAKAEFLFDERAYTSESSKPSEFSKVRQRLNNRKRERENSLLTEGTHSQYNDGLYCSS